MIKQYAQKFLSHNRTYATQKSELEALKHLVLKRSTPDGNCLFHSVSNALFDTEEKHMKIRSDTINWMKHNMDTKIDGLEFKHCIFLEEGETIEDYIQRMSQNGEWGDFSCIVAMSRNYDIWFKIVFVVNGKAESIIDVKPEHDNVKNTIWLAYSERAKHYDLLVRSQLTSRL
jgi:hypothetical protein